MDPAFRFFTVSNLMYPLSVQLPLVKQSKSAD